MLNVLSIATGKSSENCYVIYGKDKKAIIIDPGDNAEKIIELINLYKFIPLAIINTHAHYDHTGAISGVKDYYNIPFYLHSSDKKLLSHTNFYRKLFLKSESIKVPKIDFFLDDINELKIDNFNIKIIHTPGHTKGSVCIQIKNYLFTGDILFKGTIGNTEFPESNEKDLYDSLKKLSSLNNDIKIYPGHGESSSIRDELISNKKFINAININKRQGE